MQQLGFSPDWQSASSDEFPALNKDEVHIWWLPLVLSEYESELALSLLSDIQRDKYHRRTTAELKQAYLAGRYYLLNLLAAYTNDTPDKVELSYSRLNKPSLSDSGLRLDFNFTDTNFTNAEGHCNYSGVFAFSRARAVGVDIEHRGRAIDLSKIVAKRFTEQERLLVFDGEQLNREKALSIWTRKEAYGKATGKGLNFKMNSENLVATSDIDSISSFAFCDSQDQTWRCLPLQLGEEFAASVVHEGHQNLNLRTFNSFMIFANQTP